MKVVYKALPFVRAVFFFLFFLFFFNTFDNITCPSCGGAEALNKCSGRLEQTAVVREDKYW